MRRPSCVSTTFFYSMDIYFVVFPNSCQEREVALAKLTFTFWDPEEIDVSHVSH